MPYKKLIKASLFVSSVFLFSSCANYFIKKDCEKKNWYQVGYDAALRGERISNDPDVSQCRKVDAEISESQLDVGFKAGMSRYCQAEGVFQTGKNGDLFNTDFCEPNQMAMLKRKHQEGLDAYCTDGTTAGLSGKKYKNVCQAKLEKTFLPDYRKGRKKYLGGMVQNSESKMQMTQGEINRLQNQKRDVDNRLAFLPLLKIGAKDQFAPERQRLNDESWQISNAISNKNQELNRTRQEIDNYKQEMATLD